MEIRCGDMSCGSDLTDAVQKELYLQYQKKNQDVNTISSSLEQTRNAQVKEQKDGSKVVSMDITVSGLPQYRIDGTEILYDIREGDSQDYRLNSYDPGREIILALITTTQISPIMAQILQRFIMVERSS